MTEGPTDQRADGPKGRIRVRVRFRVRVGVIGMPEYACSDNKIWSFEPGLIDLWSIRPSVNGIFGLSDLR